MTIKPENYPGAILTVKDLAGEIGLAVKSTRKWLRDKAVEKPGKRWEWDLSDPQQLQQINDLIKYRTEKVKKTPQELLGSEEPGALDTPKTILDQVNRFKRDEEFIITPDNDGDQMIETQIYERGNWTIWKGSEGIQARYISPKSSDLTKWIKEESEIRPSLPKYIKEVIIQNL